MHALWVLSLVQEKVSRLSGRDPTSHRICRNLPAKERAFGSFRAVPKGTRPQAKPRRRKVRFASFSPKGSENCARSLAPPLPTETADAGFRWGPQSGGAESVQRSLSGVLHRHVSHARRPPAFCRPDLPHFCAAYGRLVLVFKPSVCTPNGAHAEVPRHSRRPGGCDSRSIRTQEAGGRRGKLGNRGFRTPEREERSATERGVSRGPSPWTRSLGTFSGARESTSPAGTRPGKTQGPTGTPGEKGSPLSTLHSQIIASGSPSTRVVASPSWPQAVSAWATR